MSASEPHIPTPPSDPFEDHIDDVIGEEDLDEEELAEEECGRWRNGNLVHQCLLAGTEWCDWDCPIGLPHRARK